MSIFEVLERHKFTSEFDIPTLAELPARDVFKLYESLHEAIYVQQLKRLQSEPPESPFRFMASAALRGDTGCGNWPCRARALDFMGRYAALHSDTVLHVLPLKKPLRVKRISEARLLLGTTLFSLFQLRPVIDAGIIEPAVMLSAHCIHTIEWVNEMVEVVHKVANRASAAESNRFQLVYQSPEKAPTGRSTVYVTGPEEYLEHGEIVYTFDEPAGWKPRSWKLNGEGKIELRGRRKLYFVDRIFNSIANDTTFYLDYGRMLHTRYLTSLPGEAFLLDFSTDDEKLAQSSAAVTAYLSHAVPLLTEVPLAVLVRLRRQQRDSFLRYRDAVERMINDVLRKRKKITRKEAVEIYSVYIEPELRRMRKDAAAFKRTQRNRILAGASTLAAVVAIGAFGGSIPAGIAGVIASGGVAAAGRVLGGAIDQACHHGAATTKNDFYFLLRLVEEVEDSN